MSSSVVKQTFLFTINLVFATITAAGTQGWLNVKDFGAVGDGFANDSNAINAAISSSGEKASTIYFPPGVYRSGCIKIVSNRTLRGENATLVCLDKLNTNWVWAQSCSNVVIEGIMFDGNARNNMASAKDPGHTFASDTLTILQCSNFRVINCTFVNASDTSVMLSQSRDCKILNNHFDGALDLGIYVNNDWSTKADNDGNALADCIISANTFKDCACGGIALKRVSRRMIIANNAIHNCGNGITLEQASLPYDYSTEVLITGNEIRHIGNWPDQKWPPLPRDYIAGYGINLRGSSYSVVANNRIDDCYNYSILVDGSRFCSITGNVVKGSSTKTNENQQIGIAMTARNFSVPDQSVAEYFKPCIYDNKMKTCTIKTSYCAIVGNVVCGHKNYGIYEQADGAEQNSFTGNVCVNNSRDILQSNLNNIKCSTN